MARIPIGSIVLERSTGAVGRVIRQPRGEQVRGFTLCTFGLVRSAGLQFLATKRTAMQAVAALCNLPTPAERLMRSLDRAQALREDNAADFRPSFFHLLEPSA